MTNKIRKLLSDQDNQKILEKQRKNIEQYRKEGKSVKEIAKVLSLNLHKLISAEEVKNFLTKEALPSKSDVPFTNAKKNHYWTKKEDILLKTLRSLEYSLAEVAAYLNNFYDGDYFTRGMVSGRIAYLKQSSKEWDSLPLWNDIFAEEGVDIPEGAKKDKPSTKSKVTSSDNILHNIHSVNIQNIKNDGKRIETTLELLSGDQVKDESAVLTAFGYDPNKWRIIKNRSNFYQMPSQDEGKKTMWQVKIDIEPIGSAITIPDFIDLCNEHEVKPIEVTQQDWDNSEQTAEDNLVLAFADLHFGISTWQTMYPYLKDLLDLLRSKPYKKIVIEQLGDLFHSDSFTTIRTNSGTLLSTDGKEVKMETAVHDALDFYETVIKTALLNTDQVEIYHTQGNHSADLEYMFLLILEQKFPQIKIHENIQYRTAYLLDNVGIMIAHGDTAKKRLPMLFANEYSDIWGKANYRTIHSGHFHKQVVEDENGVVWYQVGTPKPSDGYELKNGFTMAHKMLQAFEYSPDSLKAAYYLG